MDHLVKYLQCKQEDLSPDPVYPTENSRLGNPMSVMWRQKG